jgi:hypothetical protein
MRKAVAAAFAVLLLGVVGFGAVRFLPRARLLWRIHQLRSRDDEVSLRAFAEICQEKAADLRRERASLLPALDAFVATSAGQHDYVSFATVLLTFIGHLDEAVLVDARRYEFLEPAAYQAFEQVAPEHIPPERCEITLEAALLPEGATPVRSRASAWDLETGRHPQDPSRSAAFRFDDDVPAALRFDGDVIRALEAGFVDLGDLPLEDVHPARAPSADGSVLWIAPAATSHTFVVRRPNDRAIAFRVTDVDPGKRVHIIWRVLRAEPTH